MYLFDQILSKIHALIPNQEKKKINFHFPQPFQSPQRKPFLTWHLGVNLNK
jgi:hypothetical protein